MVTFSSRPPFIASMGSKRWCSGESARLLPMWPGFKSRCWRHMCVEFVVGSLLCSERFFSGCSGFPLSSKSNISKFQFDQESGRWRSTLLMCYLQIIIFLFFFLFSISCMEYTASICIYITKPVHVHGGSLHFHLRHMNSHAVVPCSWH